MAVQRITILSQGVIVHDPNMSMKAKLEKNVNSDLVAPKLVRNRFGFSFEDGDLYYFYDKQANDYYYHKAQLEKIKIALDECLSIGSITGVDYTEAERSEGTDVEFKNYKFDMRVEDPESRFFFQNEVSDVGSDPANDQTIFEIQTGRGKTKTFQKVMVRVKKRTAIIVRPAYTKKWKQDCVDDESGLYEASPRVMLVSGVAGIDKLLAAGMDGTLDRKNISTIILPTTSLKMWLEEFSNRIHRDGIELKNFFNILGVGLVGYDEIHEHFLTVYLSGLILNPPKLIEMSATLKPSQKKEFIRHRYIERFPKKNRVDVPYIRVCDIAFVYYSIGVKRMRDRVNGMQLYNHKTFEQYVYQHGMRDAYFDMIYDLLKRAYFNNYQEGQRSIVFFSMIQPCTDFKVYLEERMRREGMPNLKVRRYVDTDPYSDLMEADIAISSPDKAGTAVDLPGLVLALVTTAIDDRQKNEQIAGRPRTVTQWEGVKPKVLFLHCMDIKKHNTYLNSRKEALAHVALSLNVVNGGYSIEGKEKENYKLSPKTAGGKKKPDRTCVSKAMGRFDKFKNKQAWKAKKQKRRSKSKGRRR